MWLYIVLCFLYVVRNVVLKSKHFNLLSKTCKSFSEIFKILLLRNIYLIAFLYEGEFQKKIISNRAENTAHDFK